MSRTCSICPRSDVPKINEALGAGESFRSVAIRFCASKSSLARHATHIPEGRPKGIPGQNTGVVLQPTEPVCHSRLLPDQNPVYEDLVFACEPLAPTLGYIGWRNKNRRGL